MNELERVEKARAEWKMAKRQGHKKHFNAMKVSHRNKSFKERRTERQPIETLACSCGNKIRMFNKLEAVKCFNCNSWYDKTEKGWIKDKVVLPKGTMTFADLMIKVRKK